MSAGAGGPPQAGPGGAFPYPFIFVAGDPSVAPGRTAPVGTRAFLLTGAAAWDKKTTSDTGWVPVGSGSGGGSVLSVTGAAPGIVDNTDPANPVIDLATEAHAGAMSAAQVVKLDLLPSPGWFDDQVAFFNTLGLGLTAFDYVKCGQNPNGLATVGTGITDANQPGGALALNAAAWVMLTNHVVILAKSSNWVFGYRGSLPIPTSTHTSVLGLSDDTHLISVGAVADFATSPTNMVVSAPFGTSSATSSFVIDGNVHDIQVAHSVSAHLVYLFVDALLVGQVTDASLSDASPLGLGLFSKTGTTATVQKIAYGYVEQ